MISQLTVFLENEKGRLAAACRAVSDAGINMHALNLADTSDFGVVRMLTDTPEAAAEALREGERLLRAAGVGVRDVGAGARNDAAAQPLGRGARRRQTAELLRAGGHECMPGHQFAQNAVRKALGRAVIPAGDAEQAGTDENGHRAPRFPRLHVKPKIMPSTPPAMCVSWARPAVPVTA